MLNKISTYYFFENWKMTFIGSSNIKNFPQKLKLEKINGTLIILLYISISPFPQPTTKNLLILLKAQKKNILQQATCGNTPVLVIERMLEHFLKILPLKKKLLWNFYKKENFKPEMTPIIENLHNEVYQ